MRLAALMLLAATTVAAQDNRNRIPPVQVSRVTLTAPTAPGDTTDHVDVRTFAGVQLVATAYDQNGKAITSPRLTWSSANWHTATVTSSGRVYGFTLGATTITVSSGDKSASVRACVSSQTFTLVPADRVTTIAMSPAQPTAKGHGSVPSPIVATIQYATSSTTWPIECLHWTLAPSSDSGVVLLNRRGLVRVPIGARDVIIAATAGTQRPTWVP
jgi:Bacterial Ig-like domain (group 2)